MPERRSRTDSKSLHTLEATCLLLMKHMEASMIVGGGNNFKIPRVHKAGQEREGRKFEHIICERVCTMRLARGKTLVLQCKGAVYPSITFQPLQ